MRQRKSQARERADSSRTDPAYPARPASPATWRSAVSSAIAALLIIALGGATFAFMSTQRSGQGTSGPPPPPTVTPTMAPTAIPSPTVGASPLRAPKRGAGLPAGVEVVTYAPTGTDEGWATGAVNIDPMTGMPDRGMVLRYAGGTWTQVGAALPGAFLSGIDMLSSSEGWIGGIDDANQHLMLHIHNGTWQQVAPPAVDPGALPSIRAMRTPDEGWLAMANAKGAQSGANTSLFHVSGGTWSLVRTPLKYITDIAPIADGEAWVIGWNGDGTSSLAHIQGGVATVALTSPGNSSFSRLRAFAPNDIWIEGAKHDSSNADIDDEPLDYHFDGEAWSRVSLSAPKTAQHVGIVASQVAWSFASVEPSPRDATAYGQIASIYSNAGGQWTALSVPYKDLQTLTVVSSSSTDVWAEGVYMVTTQGPDHNGAKSFASVSHYVLLRYSGGSWTEYGR